MDMARSEVRKLAAEDYSTVGHLEHASEQARERNYQDFLIVDVDAHHYENESYNEVFTYIESPVIRRQAVESAKRGARASMWRRSSLATRANSLARAESISTATNKRIANHESRITSPEASVSPYPMRPATPGT